MALLEVRGLTKRFGGLLAVSGVDFAVEPGEVCGIIGPNGAGKTTLFHLVTGFHHATAGEVRFDGRSITGLRPHQVCRLGIARTFQIVQPFPGLSVLDNAAVGAFTRHREVEAARATARETLELVGLGDQADRLAGTLTLSDRRRLELARALATAPRVLLLDEVMSGLTPTEVSGMIDLCRRLRARGPHDPGDRAPPARDHGALGSDRRAGPRREDRRGRPGGRGQGPARHRGLPRRGWREGVRGSR